jgi:hypothetical protein
VFLTNSAYGEVEAFVFNSPRHFDITLLRHAK